MCLGSGVHIPQESTAAHPYSPGGGINRHSVDVTQVDHQTALADRDTRGVVAATAYRDLQVVFPAELDRGGYVGSRLTTSDHRWAAVDTGVPYRARCVVPGVAWVEYGPSQDSFEGAAHLCHRILLIG
jgi:hypothetical protein